MTFNLRKEANGKAKSCKRGDAFVRVHKTQNSIGLSAAVRDVILPHKFVSVAIDPDAETLTLTPSDDPDDYSVTSINSTTTITYARLAEHIALPRSERIPVKIVGDSVVIRGKLVRHDL